MSRFARGTRWACAVGFAALVGLVWAGQDVPEPRQPGRIEEGRFLFRTFCSNCHGETATGQGPMADLLTVEVPDLTRIAERNGGTFPREVVYRIVDGREDIAAHGARRRMPIWGLNFQQLNQDTNQEAVVRDRIGKLIDYLESIQQPGTGSR